MSAVQILQAHGYDVATADPHTTYVTVASISAASFTANAKYLILAAANFHVASISNEGRLQLKHGSTVFSNGGYQAFELQSGQEAGAGWMFVWTQPGTTEAITLEISTSSASTSTCDWGGIVCINLDDIGTQGTDYYYTEDTTLHSDHVSYTDTATTTFTPNGTDDWLIIGNVLCAGMPTNSQMYMRLNDSVAGALVSISEEGEDNTNEHRGLLMMQTVTPTNASHTFSVQTGGEGTSSDTESARIFALNLSKFAQHSYSYAAAEQQPTILPTWTTTRTLSITPSVTGSWFYWGYLDWKPGGLNDAGNHRIQINPDGGGLTTLPNTTSSPGNATWDATDVDPFNLFYVNSFNSGASRTINFDTAVSAGTTPRVLERCLVAFSAELATTGVTINCSAAAITVGEQSTTLIKGAKTVQATAKNLALAGQHATVSAAGVAQTVNCSAGALTVGEQSATLIKGAKTVQASAGSLTLNEQAGDVLPGAVIVDCGTGVSYHDSILALQSANLVAYWPLDEAVGAGTAEDDKNSYDGTNSGITAGQTGIGDGGTSYGFGANDYSNVYSAGWATEIDAIGPVAGTVAGWAKVSGAGIWTDAANHYLFDFGDGGNDRVFVYKTTTNNTFRLRMSANGTLITVTTTLSTTDWFHWAVTWDKSANEFKGYIDGVQVDTTQTIPTVWQAGATATANLIGAFTTASPNSWDGNIAHVAVWDIALSVDDIGALASVNPPAAVTNLTLAGQTAIISSPPPAQTVTCAACALTVGEQSATLTKGAVTVQSTVESLALAGQTVTLQKGATTVQATVESLALVGLSTKITTTIPVDVATLTLAGQTADVTGGAVTVQTSSGSLTLAGLTATVSSASAPARTINCSAGALVIGEQSVTLQKGAITVQVAAESLALAGQTATLLKGAITVQATAGSLALAGQVAKITTTIPVDVAALVLAGQTADVTGGAISVLSSSGSLTLAGQTATISSATAPARVIDCTVAALVIGEQSATLIKGATTVQAGAGILALGGQSVTLTKGGTTVQASAGALTLSGQTAVVTASPPARTINCTAGSLTLAGQTADLLTGAATVQAVSGTLTLAGRQAQAFSGIKIDALALTLAGQAATILKGATTVQANDGALTLTALSAAVSTTTPARTINCAVGTLAVTPRTATVTGGAVVIQAAVETLSLAGQQADVQSGESLVTAGVGTLVLTGQTAGIQAGEIQVESTNEALSLATYPATIVTGAISISCAAGAIVLSGESATLDAQTTIVCSIAALTLTELPLTDVIPGATVVQTTAGVLVLDGHATILAPPAYVPTYLQMINVPGETRTVEILEDPRTFTIEWESRGIDVTQELRSMDVEYENRAFVVEDDP